jgi:methionine-rich copper-binding protein CopC
MTLPRLAGCWLFLASLVVAGPSAWADDLRVLATGPVNNGVIDGPSDEFYVRFNQPVDHIRSEFIIKRGDDIVETLQPRFKTEPTVLFARRSALPPGSYTLVWEVKTLEGQQIAVGEIPFTAESRK